MAIDSPPQIERDRAGRPLPPPGVRPTSLRLAAIVPLTAVVMLAIFIVINSFDSSPPTRLSVSPKLARVSGLTISPISPFAPYATPGGEPPPNIVHSVVFPKGTSAPTVKPNQGQPTSFDRALVFHSPASSQALYTFFHEQMNGRGWRIFSTGAPVNAPGVEVLAQKAGNDGWYWEQGVTVSPTTFSDHGRVQSTKVTVRLYQASEE